MRSLSERLDRLCVPVTESGCWIWLGATGPRGYGKITVKTGVSDYSHRVSWRLHNGEIPAGMHVCHKCDTPSCINPDHLFLGTHDDNMRDMRNKNRAADGGRHPFAKLNAATVEEMRGSNDTCESLAIEYGVSRSAVSNARLGKSWRGAGCEVARNRNISHSRFVAVLGGGPMSTHQVASALSVTARYAASNLSKLFKRGKVGRAHYVVNGERGQRKSFVWESVCHTATPAKGESNG